MRDILSLLESNPQESGNLLLELDWYDKSPLQKVLLRNRGRWIHFTRGVANRVSPYSGRSDAPTLEPMPDKAKYDTGGYGWSKRMKQYNRELTRVTKKNGNAVVPKLGINPKPMHRDPMGIYLYPVDWLLSGTERIRNGMQYGLDFKYYYVCDIKLNDPNGIILQKITWEQIGTLAQRNGWKDDLDEFRKLPPEEQKKILPSYCNPNVPGSFLWHFVEKLKDKIHWNAAFRGVSFIQDAGGSIIHTNEPDQILVLNPAVIRVVEQGDNQVQDRSKSNEQPAWMYAITNILKAVRGEVGGDLVWDKKKPSLTFKIGWASFRITMPEREYDVNLNVNVTYGRAIEDYSINWKTFQEQSQDQIVSYIVTRAKRIAARKSDISFVPCIQPKQAKEMATNRFGMGQVFEFKETVHNSDERKWNSLTVNGTSPDEDRDRVAVSNRIYFDISPDNYSASVYVFFNQKSVVYGSSEKFASDQHNEIMQDLLTKFLVSAESHFQSVSPDNKYAKSWEKLATHEELIGYKGWFVLNCGVSIGGLLSEHYATEVAAFEGLAKRERESLLSEISYKLSNRKY